MEPVGLGLCLIDHLCLSVLSPVSSWFYSLCIHAGQAVWPGQEVSQCAYMLLGRRRSAAVHTCCWADSGASCQQYTDEVPEWCHEVGDALPSLLNWTNFDFRNFELK